MQFMANELILLVFIYNSNIHHLEFIVNNILNSNEDFKLSVLVLYDYIWGNALHATQILCKDINLIIFNMAAILNFAKLSRKHKDYTFKVIHLGHVLFKTSI